MVAGLKEGGLAASDGRINVGDSLLTANGVDMRETERVKDIFRCATGLVEFVVRPAAASAWTPQARPKAEGEEAEATEPPATALEETKPVLPNTPSVVQCQVPVDACARALVRASLAHT